MSGSAGSGARARPADIVVHMRRRPRIPFLSLLLALAAVPATAAFARPQSEPPKRVRPGDAAAQGAADEGAADAPRFPAALPEGAVLPAAAKVPAVRPDAFSGRVSALERVMACPKCDGKGSKVTRKRQSRGTLSTPRIVENSEECPECHGYGFALAGSKVGPVLDALASALGGLAPDLAAAPKLMDRARATLQRVGAGGGLVDAVTAVDRNELTGGRLSKPGTPVTVAGEVGDPILLAGGSRAYPVLVDGRDLLLVRAPAINAAPKQGPVLVGGTLAGAMSGAEWDFGRTLVIDHGFIVPRADPVKLHREEPGEQAPPADGTPRNP
jgi:hypothetical protein